MKTEKDSGRLFISNNAWRAFLGQAMFQIPLVAGRSAFDERERHRSGPCLLTSLAEETTVASAPPEQQSKQQQRGDWQVNLSYPLGLDWEIPLQFQKVRTRERTLEELKKAAQGQVLGQVVIGTVAELRPQVTIAETKAQKLREQLASF